MKAFLQPAGIALIASAIASTASAQQAFQRFMGEPIDGLTASELARFEDGLIEFEAILTEADGLGPIFNDSSCAQCHSTPATGGFSTRVVTRFQGPGGSDLPGGSLQQIQALPAVPSNMWETVPAAATVTSQRSTPHMFGAGLVDAIPDSAILANELNPPHPMVSGFANMKVPAEGGAPRPGRFGWKGGVPSVLTFSADASLNELGLTNRFFMNEEAPNGDQSVVTMYDNVADPDDSGVPGHSRIDRQTDFQRYLAPPAQTPRSGMTGELVFNSIGCNACHTSTYTTSTVAESALSNVTFKPYADFLLHDMGSLGDGIVDGIATQQIMMTRPLWGMAQRDAFLHDNRGGNGDFFENVDLTIQFHDGEAAFSRDAYNNLTQNEKDQLFSFLLSLGRTEFDYESNSELMPDNDVDIFDWFFLEPLITGPFPSPPVHPDDPAAIGDADRDGDFDLDDFIQLQQAFTG